jgi:hypothetical protein
MIESIMYVGIGFLLATLIGVAVIPLVHKRAVQLTIRRLEDSIPQSIAEIHADKDALRAEFAMSTRRLETTVEQLQNKTANQLVELGKRGDAINRLKTEREAHKVEVVALKTEVNSLKERLTTSGKEVEAAAGLRHERDVASLVPRALPPAERVRPPMDSLQGSPPDESRHEGDLVSLVPNEYPKAEANRSGAPARDLNAGGSPDQRISAARNGSDFSAGLQAGERSLHASSGASVSQFASHRPWTGRRISRSVARGFVAALIGAGATFAWQSQGDEAKEVVRTWVSSLGSLLSASTTKSPPGVDVATKQTAASEPPVQDGAVQQPEPVPQTAPAPGVAATSPERSEEQLTARQEQTPDNIGTPQAVGPDTKQNTAPPSLQNDTQLAPTPETRPTTVEGWTLREVTDGTAVLEGPAGIRRVTPGDTVPGVGKIESYLRSNGRWIVLTSSGPISMPDRQNTSSPPLQLTPTPETRPTIKDWTLREVIDGTAVLQGPGGIRRVTRGDSVPGLGRVDSIVRWGNRWIVATSSGYCESALPNQTAQDGICKPYRGH